MLTANVNRTEVWVVRFDFWTNPFSIIDDFDMWFYVACVQAKATLESEKNIVTLTTN